MKKYLPVLFIFFFFPSLSFSASYPVSCPVEAESIIDAVGGCAVIDPGQYSSIYGKCCSTSATLVPESSSEPTLEEPQEYIPELTPDTITNPENISQQSNTGTLSAPFIILISILFWGGLICFVVWFVRKLKKKKNSASTTPMLRDKK
jgi:hypothetical protein